MTTNLPLLRCTSPPMRLIAARLPLCALLLCAALCPQARADQRAIGPASGRVEMRAYGLGLFPADGNFTRFHGVMRYDPAQPKACQVMLEIDPSSLRMATEAMTEQVTGARFLDTQRYPAMEFNGTCHNDVIAGELSLHGQTHPFELDLQHDGRQLTATGRLYRRQWGIDADPITVGATIRIRVELTLTAEGDHA